MFSKPLAVVVLAAVCVTAAAGGAYVASRQSGTAPAAGAHAASPAVHETEAVVAPPVAPDVEGPAATLAVAEQSPPAPVTRREARPEVIRERPAAPARATRAARPGSSTERERQATGDEPRGERAGQEDLTAGAGAGRVVPGDAVAPADLPEDEAVGSRAAAEAPEPASTAARSYVELMVPASSVLGLQIQTPLSSERARIEDRVEARVLRDVLVDGRTAIPQGTRIVGAVTLVERGGKVRERARLGVRFHTLVLADGTELPVRTDAILREGDSPVGESARKIGGAAVGGAILGAILGGKKGAILGGATGAAGGSAAVMAGDRNPATLPLGAVVTVRLAAPVAVEVEHR